MPEDDSFSMLDLGAMVAQMLGLTKGDAVEIQKDKLDRNRCMIIRLPGHAGDTNYDRAKEILPQHAAGVSGSNAEGE
jgi:hypothetical protein